MLTPREKALLGHAPLQPPADLWRAGLNTYEISILWDIPESRVYNALFGKEKRSGLRKLIQTTPNPFGGTA